MGAGVAQVGMVAWLLAVVTIQLGITHPSVARVRACRVQRW